ncbi:hypothetical protein [Cognatiyoonia sp. IB215182]|nr:hypothetical protein [Cognatiyoonia sp. IB215182]MDX8354373.1 hypothetical protein [Cognatiyoonia sp. IB215182]
MKARWLIPFACTLLAGVVLAGLFTLYQNPLFELYLIEWGLC